MKSCAWEALSMLINHKNIEQARSSVEQTLFLVSALLIFEESQQERWLNGRRDAGESGKCAVNVCIRFGLGIHGWFVLVRTHFSETPFESVRSDNSQSERNPWKANRSLSMLRSTARVGGHMQKIQFYSKNATETAFNPALYCCLFGMKINQQRSRKSKLERSVQRRKSVFVSISPSSRPGRNAKRCGAKAKKVHKQVLKTKSSSDSVSSRESPLLSNNRREEDKEEFTCINIASSPLWLWEMRFDTRGGVCKAEIKKPAADSIASTPPPNYMCRWSQPALKYLFPGLLTTHNLFPSTPFLHPHHIDFTPLLFRKNMNGRKWKNMCALCCWLCEWTLKFQNEIFSMQNQLRENNN